MSGACSASAAAIPIIPNIADTSTKPKLVEDCGATSHQLRMISPNISRTVTLAIASDDCRAQGANKAKKGSAKCIPATSAAAPPHPPYKRTPYHDASFGRSDCQTINSCTKSR